MNLRYAIPALIAVAGAVATATYRFTRRPDEELWIEADATPATPAESRKERAARLSAEEERRRMWREDEPADAPLI